MERGFQKISGIEQINGSTRSDTDYEELIRSLLAIEAYDDIADGSDPKGKWGKWGKYRGRGRGRGRGGFGGR